MLNIRIFSRFSNIFKVITFQTIPLPVVFTFCKRLNFIFFSIAVIIVFVFSCV